MALYPIRSLNNVEEKQRTFNRLENAQAEFQRLVIRDSHNVAVTQTEAQGLVLVQASLQAAI